MATGGHDRWVSASQRGPVGIEAFVPVRVAPDCYRNDRDQAAPQTGRDRYGTCPRGSMRLNPGHAVRGVVPSKIPRGRRCEMRRPPGLRSWDEHKSDRVSRWSRSSSRGTMS